MFQKKLFKKKKPELEVPSEHVQEKKKISLKRKEYKPVKSSIDYPSILEGLLDDKNTIKQTSLFESFKSTKERIGVKAYLRYLGNKGLVIVDSDEKDIYYKFLGPSQVKETTKPHEKKRFSKEEYPAELEKLMKDSKIKLSDIDAVFKTRNERRSIKQFINHNYIAKGLVKRVDDPSGAYYQFEPSASLKT